MDRRDNDIANGAGQGQRKCGDIDRWDNDVTNGAGQGQRKCVNMDGRNNDRAQEAHQIQVQWGNVQRVAQGSALIITPPKNAVVIVAVDEGAGVETARVSDAGVRVADVGVTRV